MPRGLLALDLDGTLLRPDGTIDPLDAAAVRRLLAAGWEVTLATGRLAPGTLPAARALGLTAPLVCADGGLIACALTGDTLARDPLRSASLGRVLAALSSHGVAAFVLTGEAILCDPTGEPHLPWMRGWAPSIAVHPALAEADPCTGDQVLFAVGLGTEDAIENAHAALDQLTGEPLGVARFSIGDELLWAVRVAPGGCTKASGLARVAADLAVDRADVVAVGDWYNDVAAFHWAGRSFAMGQSPAAVKDAATHVLEATTESGGAIAEVVALLTDDLHQL